MGGRLVHEEEVRRVDQEFDEVKAGLFSTAQDGGLLVDVILAEEEGPKDAAGIVLGEFAVTGFHLIEDGLVRIEGSGTVLAEIADLSIRSLDSLPFLELEHAGKDLKQG